MSYNTNRTARKMRSMLGQPKQYTHSPYQWGTVHAVHNPRTTTLSTAVPAGSLVIETAASIEANALIIVGNGGPVQVQSVSGSGPFMVTLTGRGVPNAQSSGATVRVLPTVDLYVDGWQRPPANLPPGVTQTLTVGVRYLFDYAPLVGHVVLMARGTGLQRSDRVVLGPLSPAAVPSGTAYCTGGSSVSGSFQTADVGAAENLKGGMLLNTIGGGTGLQVPVAGLYHVDAQMSFAGGPNGYVGIGKNGTLVKQGSGLAASGLSVQGMASSIVECAVNDVLNVGYNVSAGSAFILSGSLLCYVSAFRVTR